METTEYTQDGPGYGVTPSTPITIVVPGSVVAPPTFTPPAGPYTTAQTVTFNTTTYPFASFYYTTDGSTPTYPPTGTTIAVPANSSAPVSAERGKCLEDITVAAIETVNAIAVVQGYASPSAVTTGVYEIGPITGTPTFSPVAGSYGLAQTVTISDSTSGATIYYTTNGTTPTTGSSIYSSPITVSANETLEAFATSASANNSVVATAAYTIGGTAATPTFSPVAGNYVGNQSVTISDTSSGASIYYTTNGSTPTTNSPVYSAPITVSTSETLEAIAAGSGYTNSAVASAAYTISASTPTFSPVAGSYIDAQTVTISDSTSGTTIYYTTNGSTPTTNSPVYSAPITVSASETLEAIAAGGGNATSAVGSAAYTIVGGNAHFQPRSRKLRSSPDGNHQRYNSEFDHLLHHQRNHTDDQLANLLRSDQCFQYRDAGGDWPLPQEIATARSDQWHTPSPSAGRRQRPPSALQPEATLEPRR